MIRSIIARRLLLACFLGATFVQPADAQPGGSVGEIGLEALTRGAVHEGFAQPLAFDPDPGPLVSQEPPGPIEEVPPEYKPRGKGVGWMPGYWSWDADRTAFIWTSGFWRVWPPDRDYVPGYWEQADVGWRWVSGFWVPQSASEIRYYPLPPKSPEPEPISSPPAPDRIWTLGRYRWQAPAFVWSKGGWYRGQPDWIWNPPHHVWTPAGTAYIEGYWDYPVEKRALLFAPVSIPPDVLKYPNFYYRPRVLIDPQVLLDHLFCQIAGGHYLFGDYYTSDKDALGVYPWFEFHRVHGYDPLYAYYSWRQGQDWQIARARDYAYRHDHQEARPADTYLGQQSRFERRPSAESEDLWLGRSLRDAASERNSPLPLVPAAGGGDPAREGMPVPIMASTDRGQQEAALAALRAAGNANSVLALTLPRPEPAVIERPSERRRIQPEAQPPAGPSANVSPSRRLPGFRLPTTRSSDAFPLPRVPPRDLLPELQPGSQSTTPRRRTPGSTLPSFKPQSSQPGATIRTGPRPSSSLPSSRGRPSPPPSTLRRPRLQ